MSCKCRCGEKHEASCETAFQYAVKIVCGTASLSAGKEQPVALGAYFTAINIHNPSKCDAVAFRLKVAEADPGHVGGVTPYGDFSLNPDQALEIDNAQILVLFPNVSFVKGYVVIEAADELDVVAVYTVAQTKNAPGHSFFTERVPARCVPVCEDLVLPISTGVADWQTILSPSGVVGPVQPVVGPGGPSYTTGGPTSWQPPPFGSIWVSSSASDGTNALPGTYVYELCFEVCSGFSNPTLQIQGLADNSANVYLNSNASLLGSLATFSGSPTPIPVPNLALVAGRNCLVIELKNDPPATQSNPTGFAIAGLLRVPGGRCPCSKLPLLR